jgi:hypothetical protein
MNGDFFSVEARTLAQMFAEYNQAVPKRNITPNRFEEGMRT